VKELCQGLRYKEKEKEELAGVKTLGVPNSSVLNTALE
jgi:hypothetical protein